MILRENIRSLQNLRFAFFSQEKQKSFPKPKMLEKRNKKYKIQGKVRHFYAFTRDVREIQIAGKGKCPGVVRKDKIKFSTHANYYGMKLWFFFRIFRNFQHVDFLEIRCKVKSFYAK